MKKYRKKILVVGSISFIVFLLSIFFKNDSQLIQTLQSLCENLVASCFLIYLIDLQKELEEENRIKERRSIIYSRLIYPINEFQFLAFKLYKLTTSEKDFKVDYIRDENEKMFDNIFLLNNKLSSRELEPFSLKEKTYQTIITEGFENYIRAIELIYNNESYFIDNNLAKLLEQIVAFRYNFRNSVFYTLKTGQAGITTHDLMKFLGFKEIFQLNKKIKSIISEYTEMVDIDLVINRLIDKNSNIEFMDGI